MKRPSNETLAQIGSRSIKDFMIGTIGTIYDIIALEPIILDFFQVNGYG